MRTPGARAAWLILLAALWLMPSAPLRAQPLAEYAIKAALLFNFLLFIEWPAASFASAESPIVLGVLGEYPFRASLDDLVHAAAVERRRVVRHFADIAGTADTGGIAVCLPLFVNVHDAAHLEAAMDTLRGHATLTVGDTEDFLERGGMIQLVTQDDGIQLRIKLAAATAAHLRSSSKLLRPAQIISMARP